MQTTKEDMICPLDLNWQENKLILNQQTLTSSILIDETWQIDHIDLTTLSDWLRNPKRKTCVQIISHPSKTLIPATTLDLYWSQGIGIDLLNLITAKQQACIMHQSHQAFQWLILCQGSALD
jgi:hypothetical protein